MQNFYTCFRCSQSWPEDFFEDIMLKNASNEKETPVKICKQCLKDVNAATLEATK